MFDLAREIIGTQPILAVFLAIGVGYLVGQINLGGFSLGVGAVLFVGLAIGAFAPKAQIIGPIGLTGLIMFLYGIGILYGRQFFEGMTGAAGRKYNLLALVAVVAGLLVALGLGQTFGIKVGHTLGIFAGSMTSTATLQAALDVMRNSEPSIGYSIAYPFGVIGPILCIYFMTRQVQPKFPPKAQRFHMGEVTLGDSCAGRTLEELGKDLPSGVQVTMVRKGGPEHRSVGRSRAGGRRRPDDRRRTRGSHRRGGDAAGTTGARTDRQGSLRPRLHPGLRRQGQHGRRAAGAAAAAGRFPGASAARPALRHGHRPDARSDAGVRRPGRRADAARPQGGDPAAFRRHREGRRRSSATFRSGSAWCWAFCSG